MAKRDWDDRSWGRTEYTEVLDWDASGNPIYIGLALQGTADGDPGWQIRKLTFDGSNNLTRIQYADGSTAFDKVWTARVGYAYS